ncbi:MAG: amidohydrolase [Niveispirillum sp.]|uniref:amidohydrolase n=1 Tax=Niveispirillum sp. TaxID=1917217 RepID=UPI003BA48D36
MGPSCFHHRATEIRSRFAPIAALPPDILNESVQEAMSAASAGSVIGQMIERAADGVARLLGFDPAYLFHGGTIRTLADFGQTADAMLVKGQQIVALGPLADLRRAAPHGTVEIDLQGRTLLPGFVDPHMHIVASAGEMGFIDLSPPASGIYSIDYVENLLRAAIAKAPDKKTFILGAGIDPSQMVEWVNPTIDWFDRLFGNEDASQQNPVSLTAGSGHISFLNRTAMAMAEIDLANPPPLAGGKVATYFDGPNKGTASGVLVEMPAQKLMGKALKKSPRTLVWEFATLAGNLKKLFETAVANGNTMLNDAATGIAVGVTAERAILNAAMQAFGHPVRLGSASFIDEWGFPDSADLLISGSPDVSDPMFLKQAIKLFADGSNQGVTGLLREPYTAWGQDRVRQQYLGTNINGNMDINPQTLTQALAAAQRRGWQVMIHANGDGAIDNVLASFMEVDQQGLLNRNLRHRIEHCSILHDQQISDMVGLGLSPSFLIEHVVKWGPVLKKLLGDDRVQMLDRCKSVHDAGLPFSLHSDYTVGPLTPLKRVQDAVTRMTEGPDGGWVLNPAECVPIELALMAQTRFAAWQCHADTYVGTLEAGKMADLVILDDDPVRYANEGRAGDIAGIKVHSTWVNGREVYSQEWFCAD